MTLDGEVTSSFEWMGAGRYRPDPRLGAMHGGEIAVRELFYGVDGEQLFVRLDGAAEGRFGIEFKDGKSEVTMIRGKIVEMRAPLSGTRFRVTLERDDLPTVFIPTEGDWLGIA